MHKRVMLLLGLMLSGWACDTSSKAPAVTPQLAPKGLPPTDETRPVESARENPHAGLPGMAGMANPHAGMGTGEKAPFDPSMVLEGTLDATPAFKERIKPGDRIFLSVKPMDPQTGEVQRFPLAVDRLDVTSLPMRFSLSGANSMMPGTQFAGTVLLSARVDRDGEARTRQAGDIEGTLKATIPQKEMKLLLDTQVADGL